MSSSTEVIVLNANGDTTKFTEGNSFFVDDGILHIVNEAGRVVGAVRAWDQVAVTTAPDTHTSIQGRVCQCGTDHNR